MTTHLETYIRDEIESLNKDITPLQDLLSNVACTRELKSIYVSTKRQCGKTSLINKLMCEFGSSFVFTQTRGIACVYHPFLKGRVFNVHNLDSDNFLRGLAKEPFFPLQYVFTDECKLSNEQIERLYMMRAIDRKTIFIGLGTDYK
mgnify:CR=1 FL=1